MNFLTNKSCGEISEVIRKEAVSYIYFSDNLEVKLGDKRETKLHEDYISVPWPDIEQCIKAMCKAKEGKSSAVYSSFLESEYSPYPIIISARKLLFGAENSVYLVIGGKPQWQNVLTNVYCHGNIGNHPLSESYLYRDILNIKPIGYVPKRKNSKTLRWILSGFFNNNLWEQLNNVALIIVDMVSGYLPKIDKEDIEGILSYSKRISIPAIFFIKNPFDGIARYLGENGVVILAPSNEIVGTTYTFEPSVYLNHTHNEDLKLFLTKYDLRGLKINKNGFNRAIELRITESDEKIKDFFKKYFEFSNCLSKWDIKRYSRRVNRLGKALYDRVMEFTGSVSSNNDLHFDWKTHPIGEARTRFYDALWSLDESSRTIADELLDKVDSIMRSFQNKLTPKGECLRNILMSYSNQNNTVNILGKESALHGFLLNVFPEMPSLSENLIIDPDKLEDAHISDLLILLDQVHGVNKAKLLTTCSSKIMVLNYPWQIDTAKKSVEDVENVFLRNSFSTVNIAAKRNDKPANLFKVSVTGHIDKPENFEEERLFQADEHAENDSFISDISSDLIEEYEDSIDEDLSFQRAMTDNNQFEVQKWVVPVENREILIPENRHIIVVREKDTELVKANELRPGDTILIARDFNLKSLSDFVWQIMEKKFGIKRKNHPGNQWRVKLKEYILGHPGISYPEILEKLKDTGAIGIKTPAAIYLWLEYDDIIGPHDLETVRIIAKLVNAEEKWMEWWNGITQIRKIHRRILHNLWQVFSYSAKNLKERPDEDYVVDRNLGIKISEISELVRFTRVTGNPKKMQS